MGGVRVDRLSALLFAAIAACGGQVGSSTPPLKASEFPAAAARAFCDNQGPCCTKSRRSSDPAKCLSLLEPAFKAIYSLPAGAPDVQLPGRCIDVVASAARECREWYACPEFLEAASIHGAKGEPCSATCYPFNGSLACGGDGGNGTKSCYVSDGLFCSSRSGVCESPAALGAACSPDAYSCDHSSCSSGICTSSLPEGTDCTSDTRACADGLVCESGSQFCDLVAPYENRKCTCDRLRPDGAECSDDRQCASAPCDGGQCQHRVSSDPASICIG
jgi:hypothetical protein